ncbi:MAG TPA: preprotein translocase subunit YajC [Planctomycetota bacterium]|nr:preprotein translocase subunit YajC [Planctomycetota bacterium]
MFAWWLLTLIQEGQPAPAPGGTPAPAADGGLWTMLVPMGLIFIVFYFLLIRPQQKQARERENMIGNLRKRDVVITSGGLKGRIVKIRDNEMLLVIDEKKDVTIRVLRSAVVALDQKGDAEEDEASKKDGDSETDDENESKSSEEKK